MLGCLRLLPRGISQPCRGSLSFAPRVSHIHSMTLLWLPCRSWSTARGRARINAIGVFSGLSASMSSRLVIAAALRKQRLALYEHLQRLMLIYIGSVMGSNHAIAARYTITHACSARGKRPKRRCIPEGEHARYNITWSKKNADHVSTGSSRC